MGTINTIYVCNHTHTDIGFTDYQDVCFRQHREFIDRALDRVAAPRAARRSDPIEHPGETLALDGKSLGVDLDPLAISTVLVEFASGGGE